MNRWCVKFAIVVSLCTSTIVLAQPRAIPIRTLRPLSQSAEQFGEAPGIRSLPNGHALVHDARRKRILVLDSMLTLVRVTADVAGSTGAIYPESQSTNRLIPYVGDSTLFTDFQAGAFVVIDPAGRFGRAMAHPSARDLISVSLPHAAGAAVDLQGRLIYRAVQASKAPVRSGETPSISSRDTIRLVRVDFNTRVIDSVASFSVPRRPAPEITDGPKGKPVGVMKVNLIAQAPDDWVVLPDGTIAIVREHDYHIDWIESSGATHSTPKLPFDWRRVTEDDKQAKLDSVKRIIDSLTATGRPYGMIVRARSTADGGAAKDTIIPTMIFPSFNEIPDYLPSIREGSAKADADGNVWILPATSLQARNGLLYDVVNRQGELFERVQLPNGAVIAGFGRGGVVYVARLDGPSKNWTLERMRIAR